ncbi:hypothetical protein ACL02R_23665 [Streptomyces sp. MS19]|uniref:hypothetical protein n=1 Tax=Streptomyces sp. MS19 TaxID=3385972 RepID=UPI00399F6055
MNTDNPQPVFAASAHTPWLEIIGHRLSGRSDRALVLLDRDGRYSVRWPRARRKTALPADTGTERPVPRRPAAGYDSAFHVLIAEQHATRAIRLPGNYGPAEAADVRVTWWVHDPAQLVRTGTAYGWPVISRNLGARLRSLENAYTTSRRALGPDDVAYHLSSPIELPDCGLTYRVAHVHPRDVDSELLLAQPGGAGYPADWSADHREQYSFYTEAIRSGPVALAALWLLRKPDEIRNVLDWRVSNGHLVREETDWQDEMAGLLGKLSEEEREEISKLLRDRLLIIGRRFDQGDAEDDWSGR